MLSGWASGHAVITRSESSNILQSFKFSESVSSVSWAGDSLKAFVLSCGRHVKLFGLNKNKLFVEESDTMVGAVRFNSAESLGSSYGSCSKS